MNGLPRVPILAEDIPMAIILSLVCVASLGLYLQLGTAIREMDEAEALRRTR